MATLVERAEDAVSSIEVSAQAQADVIDGGINDFISTGAGDIRSLANAINIISAINPTGDWITATGYTLKDLVIFGGITYIAVEGHTSGADFSVDLAAGKWTVHQAQMLAGSVMAYPHDVVPDGWLECDGQEVLKATFAELFAIVGDKYGVPLMGGTFFKLPDYRGEFLRGWDNARGVDPDAGSRTDRGDGVTGDNVGTLQDGEFASHGHFATVHSGASSFFRINVIQHFGPIGTSDDPTLSQGGNENRPRNINVMYLIKT